MALDRFAQAAAKYTRRAVAQTSAAEPLFALLNIGEAEDVLDVGCGAGNLTARVRGMTRGRVAGADPSEAMLAEARRVREELDIEYYLSAAEDLTFNREFDAAFANSSMQWFADPPRAFAAIRNALRPGGRFAAQAPATSGYCPQFLRAIEEVARQGETAATFATFRNPWFFRDSVEEYRLLLEGAGFRVIHTVIERMETPMPPDKAMGVFESGAAAGYLGAACYPAPLPDGYAGAFRRIVSESFNRQTGADGLVPLTFNRIMLLARNP